MDTTNVFGHYPQSPCLLMGSAYLPGTSEELMFSQHKLKESVLELQKALEVADECYTVLRAENTAMCIQNQRMKRTILDAGQLENELEEMRCQLSEKDEALSNLKTYTQNLVGNPSEEEVEEQSDRCVEMEQPVEVLKVKPSLATHVVRGVKAVGCLTLGLLVPLGIMAATLPLSYEHHATGCKDTFWSAARSLVEPCCSITYMTTFPE
ncbi:hypothetical protein DPEC_G00167320 [Dallia pectoralis]|uniref:Uncharacterized protein n=1 Tax=Dallia pectoralis TaxID=75939 RepID=A0ACC2GHM9_DALPE|nr:hypothetical protein DPEC_G00167320 [Dallia pectoralis]